MLEKWFSSVLCENSNLRLHTGSRIKLAMNHGKYISYLIEKSRITFESPLLAILKPWHKKACFFFTLMAEVCSTILAVEMTWWLFADEDFFDASRCSNCWRLENLYFLQQLLEVNNFLRCPENWARANGTFFTSWLTGGFIFVKKKEKRKRIQNRNPERIWRTQLNIPFLRPVK